MAFAHLHVHTEYSLLDGSNKIKEYVKRVKELGMTAAAITDHGAMYGVIDFYRAAREEGINPVLGCEVYVAPNSRFDRELTGGDDRYYHLVLLAENNKGYENLTKIVSRGFTEGYYYKPRVDMEVLREYHEGIIALSACLAGEVPRYIQKGLVDEAKKCALKYQDIFGKDNFFLELQDHGIPQQQTVNAALLQISKELDIPLVCTNDVHYTYAEDAKPHDILLCIQTGKKLADENRMRYEGGQYFVKSEEEMKGLFPYAWEAVENTQRIADRCHVEIEFGKTKLPHFEVPEGYDPWTYLNKLCQDGMRERYPEDNGKLQERLKYELDIIRRMGYVDYFLIVWDFINYAREHGIPVGPGRGSAAGSIVSYCLHITNIDPIRYSLLFERFLNPERVSMPDIDIDFCFERRQEVIDYVGRKYGREKVVQIVTFGTLAAKGVIRDVGRVMDLPYAFVDSIAKMIPNELNMTIDKALSANPELRKLYEGDEQVHELIDMSKRLEGLPRHTSMHAAGVVICPEAADNFVPLSRGSDGSVTTQFTMTTLEELGLLKMDFLGLRTLTVIDHAVKMIEKDTGVHIDVDHLDYDDKKVLDSLCTGRTDGVFQLESGGMKNFMKELKPQSLEDIIAGISLYRPGPMDFIPKYIRGKNNHDAITYSCPQLEPILSPTYGCIVYQEQVMQIVRDLGGYTMGRSDLVRRAMSKKKQSVMEKERANFVYGNAEEGVPGCVSNGIPEQVGLQIYAEMMDFAKYAFNKSHAACYALVAYRTAYLKVHAPAQFMAALLTSVLDRSNKVASYIAECKRMGLQLAPPDVNTSMKGFTAEGKVIHYGLLGIKNLGREFINDIIAERENGAFESIFDFCRRLCDKHFNRRAVESLIRCGALDHLGANRRQMLQALPAIVSNLDEYKNSLRYGQVGFFELSGGQDFGFEFDLPQVEEFPKNECLKMEKEMTGLFLSGHPMDKYDRVLDHLGYPRTAQLLATDGPYKDGQTVTLCGSVTGITMKKTRAGESMAFVQLSDSLGSMEVLVFPKVLTRYARFIAEGKVITVTGALSLEEEKDAKILANTIDGPPTAQTLPLTAHAAVLFAVRQPNRPQAAQSAGGDFHF